MSAIITSKLLKKATKEFRKHTAGKQRERLHYSNTLTFYNITPTPLGVLAESLAEDSAP